MKKPVLITADSTVDLSRELKERYDIRIIPLMITLGEDHFMDDGSSFTPLDMYERYHRDGMLPKTSAPGVQEFLDFFTPLVEQGYEIVHLDISAELSNTFNAARLAAAELEGVYVVDSRMLSTGVGLLAIEGAECRDKGMGAKEIAEHLESLRQKVSTSFVLDTLEFMWKGGRCTGVTALGANLLSLIDALQEGINWSLMPAYLVGMVVAAVSGIASIRLLHAIARKGRFGGFAYYCWVMGVLAIILTMIF